MAAPWEKYGNPSGRYGPDPVKVRQQQMQEEDQQMQREAAIRAAQAAERANSNSAQSNAIAAQNADLQQKRFQAELAQKGLMINEGGQIVANPNGPVDNAAKGETLDKARLSRINSLIEQVNRTQELYNAGPGATSGLTGVMDYNPFSGANSAFDTAGAQIADKGLAAFRIPGVGSQSDRDSILFDKANSPSSSNQDAAIEEKLRGIRARVEEELSVYGLPAPQWSGLNGTTSPAQQRNDAPPVTLGGGPSVTDKSARLTGSSQGPQKRLSTERQYSTDDDLAVAQRIEALFDSGASVAQINAEAARFNSSIPPAKVVEAVAWRDGLGKYADRKVYPYNKNTSIVRPDKTGRRSDTEIMMNRALLSPAGTAATTATNALGIGTLERIAPEALAQQRETNPIAAFSGDVAGMIGGTAALAKVGSKVAGKLAPSLLTGGGRAGNVARAVAPDAAYGALYNANIGENPLTGALLGAAGSGAGQLLGKGAQKVLGGVTDPAVQYLTQRNIPLSVGQVLGNRGIAGRAMNKLESLPVVGDLLARNRTEGLQAFEREALNDVVSPIGGKVSQGGAQGLEEAQNAVSGAYDNALSGLNIPGDNQFVQDVGGALAKGSGVPGLGEKFRYAVDNRVGPMFDGGSVSGPELQAALRNLRSIRSDFAKEGPMGQFAADATSQIDDAVTGLVERQAPGVMSKYNAANQAFGRLAPFENARISGINQEAITPAQLGRAVTSGTKNFGGRAKAARGDNLTDLIKYGQEVLPSTVPNSGTADRLGGMGSILLPSALGGSAYGLSTLTENPLLAAPLAVLGMLSTKTGQKAFQAAATKRSKGLKKVGGIFGRRKTQQGLGSAVTAPLLIGNE